METDLVRREALIALVRQPDLFDGWRAHRLTQEGKPDRFDTYRDLPVKFTNWTRHERTRSVA